MHTRSLNRSFLPAIYFSLHVPVYMVETDNGQRLRLTPRLSLSRLRLVRWIAISALTSIKLKGTGTDVLEMRRTSTSTNQFKSGTFGKFPIRQGCMPKTISSEFTRHCNKFHTCIHKDQLLGTRTIGSVLVAVAQVTVLVSDMVHATTH